jgi:hypothetical protein
MTDRTDYLRALCEEFIAEGRYVEAGWAGLCITAPPDIDPEELKYMRAIFFAGATYLFEGVMRIGKVGNPTGQGLEFLHAVDAELSKYSQDTYLEHVTAGHA